MKPSLFALLFACSIASLASGQDPLPSWNDTDSKRAIIAFVDRVTTPGTSDFVPGPQRIATFDNDGTLWSEKPMYFQLLYVIDRVQTMAAEHPEWKQQEPFASVLSGNLDGVAAGGKQALMQLFATTHAGMTVEEFSATVQKWIMTARHPTTGKRFNEMVFQPMLELLQHLRANGFKTFIVSGGGIEFMRPWAEATYGIPPEQVVGSSLKLEYDSGDGSPRLRKLPEIDFVDDEAGKPVGIQRHIGRRPLLAAGNSDGDFEMLEWTTSGDGPRFGLLIHHTDGRREWAYDRDSAVGKLARGLDEADRRGWIVVDMMNDWNTIYPD